jgi:hypothetical protein
MGLPVIIYGKSGSGKSRSLKFFKDNEILLINIEGKALPFRMTFKYNCRTDKIDTIIEQLQKMPCKVAVIDDAGYLMTHHFMNNHRNKKGNASFDMYDDIADGMYFLVQRIKQELPEDVIVYIMLHEDTSDAGDTKLRTIGRLIDNKVCLEGMVTICIRCMSDNGKHFFRTQTDGFDITKTPEEMFSEVEIENNLKFVDDSIRNFYGWNKKVEEKK